MKFLIGILVLILALAISAVAAYFSVVGLSAIFPATAGAVVLMGIALEAGKLVSAGWLHANWHNPRVNRLHRGYMSSAVVALMIITALGIYGFLAKGHLEQSTPLAPIELQIGTQQADIDAAQTDLKSQQARLAQLDAAVNSMIGGDHAERGLRYRKSQNAERAEIQKAIAADNAKIQSVTKDMVPLKLQVNEVETKLGPVKYVAELFGLKDTEAAVRIVILILMFAFDPLAVVMVLSAAISLSDGLAERKAAKVVADSRTEDESPEQQIDEPEASAAPEIPSEPEPEPEPEANILQELEEVVALKEEPQSLTDKEQLLDILERKPDLLQNIVDAIQDQEQRNDEKSPSWLDEGPR